MALQQSHIPPGKVMVIGFGGVAEALKKIKDSTLTATVDQLPKKQVKTAIDAVLDHIEKKTPLEDLKLTSVIVDKDNLMAAEQADKLTGTPAEQAGFQEQSDSSHG